MKLNFKIVFVVHVVLHNSLVRAESIVNGLFFILNYPTMEYWKSTVAICPSSPSVFHNDILKLPCQITQLSNMREKSLSKAGPIGPALLAKNKKFFFL